MAVDVVFEVPTGGIGEDWITIIANHQDPVTGLPAVNPANRVGSNVFVQMVSTPTSDLFVADNASFTDRITVSNVDSRFDHVYIYNGQQINAADPSADGVITDAEVLRPNINLPAASPGYPFVSASLASGTRSLRFPLRSEGIDWTNPVSGEIHLNNAIGDVIVFTNNGSGTVLTVTSGPGAGDTNPSSRLTVATGRTGGTDGDSQGFLTFTASSTYFASAGSQGRVTLENFSYDADLDSSVTLGFLPDWYELVTLSDVGAVVDVSPQIQLFDPTQFEYVPGTLSGVLDVEFDSLPPISFQVQESGTGLIPLSFTNDRDAEGTIGVLAWVTEEGVVQTQSVLVEGTFDTDTGIVSFTFTLSEDGTNGLKWFAPSISSASLAVRYLNPTGNAAASTAFNLVEDVSSNAFTLFPGHTFSRGLTVDFVNPGSSVTIESPLVADGTSSGVIELSASTVEVNSPTRASNAFRIPAGGNSAFGTITEQVTVNATVSSPSYDIRLSNDPATDSVRRSRLLVSQTGSISNVANVLDRAPGSLTPASQLFAEIVDGDAYLEGRVVATAQSYLISSPQLQPDATRPVLGEFPDFEPYYLTTKSRLTGVDVGSIEGNTLAVTLANDTFVLPPMPPSAPYTRSTAFSVLDVTTDVIRMRVQASDRVNDPLQLPFPYVVDLREANDIFVDAVAASSLPITLAAAGSVDLLGAMISAGDINITAGEEFVIGAPIQTSFGQIRLVAPEIEVRNSIRVMDTVQDERDTDISLTAISGPLTLNDAVAAINRVELVQRGDGGIIGDARIISDIVEIDADGAIGVRTNASRVTARTTARVSIDELDYGIFEVRDSTDVTLVANGYDQVATVDSSHPAYDSESPRRAFNSPALYADVYGTSVLTVSAPNGSIDVFHRGASTLALGSLDRILDGTATRMQAAGSVTIRSDLATITVNDAPTAVDSTRAVRLATTAPLIGAAVGSGPGITYSNNSPGVVSSTLTNVRITRTGVRGDQLDNVDVTSLRVGDRILVKDGIQVQASSVVSQVENGIYEITRVHYPVGDISYVGLDLRRATDSDTTVELANKHYVRVIEGNANRGKVFTADGSRREGGVPVYNGWGQIQTPNAYGDLPFANVFDNTASPTTGAVGGRSLPTPVNVSPIPSVTGFVPARALVPTAMTVGALSGEYKALSGTIEASNSGVALPPIDGVLVNVGDLVLVRYGALKEGSTTGEIDVASPGLYEVMDVGATGIGGTSSWQLRRYNGVDEDGNGAIDRFYTGRVAIDEGSLRTTRTGEMFEISLNSLGHSPLRYQEATKHVFAPDATFDSVLNYKVDIGSENPAAEVIYWVTTQGSTNNATGSFGRMLTLYQDNAAYVERTGEAQVARFRIQPGVTRIDLQQALPNVSRPIDIQATNRVLFDGSRIVRDADGAVVRGGSVIASTGPLRPSQASFSRRILRPGTTPSNEVWGLSFLDGSDGSVVSGLAFANFLNGGGIHLSGSSGVLLRDLLIGITPSGATATNKYGIRVGGDVAHTTISGVTIVGSTESGIHFDAGAQEVHVVGSTIGAVGRGNKVGIYDASANVVGNYIGAASQVGAAATFRSGVVTETTEISVSTATQSGNLVTVTTATPHSFVNGSRVHIRGVGGGYDGKWTITVLDATRFSYTAANANLPAARGGTADFANRAILRFSEDDATRMFRPGMHLFDDRNGIMREILAAERISQTIGLETMYYYDVTLENTLSGVSVGTGDLGVNDSATMQLVHRIMVTKGSDQITLPATLHPGDVFLGQSVLSLQNMFATGTTIAALSTAGGVTTITLSAPAVQSGETGLLLGAPQANILTANSDGIVLNSNSSRVVNTVVTASVFDGIRVERTASNGTHILGDSQGTSIPENEGTPSPVLSEQNLRVYSNGLAGIRLTSLAFAELANLGPTPVDGDYASIDAFLANRLRIRGNYLGYDPTTQRDVGNGQTGAQNVVVSDTGRVDQAEIRFVLLEDTSLDAEGEVRARLLGNIPSGLDSQVNRHAAGTDSVTQPVDREVTAPRRPVVR